MSLPALNALRRSESAHIHLLSRVDLSGVPAAAAQVDEISLCGGVLYAGLFVDVIQMPPQLKEFLGGFDKAFIFMSSPDPVFAANITAHIPETVFIRPVPDNGMRTHVSLFQLQQIPAHADYGKIQMTALLCSIPRPLSGDREIIALHPGSGGRKKCWPLDNYLKLMERLASQKNRDIKILLGPDEDGQAYKIISLFIAEKKLNAVVVRDRPLGEIASLLSSASLYIGNDSGISHLASVCGVAEVVIFGPTDHEIWKPLGRNVTLVRADISCSPCGRPAYLDCADPVCLAGIPVEEVCDISESLLHAVR